MSDYPSPDDLDALKQRSEELGGGMTNAVYRVTDEAVLEGWGVDEGSAILKEYDDEPALSLAVTHYGKLRDNIETLGRIRDEGREALDDLDLTVREYVDRDERMANEETAVEELAELDLDVPDVVYRDDRHMVFEEVTEATPFPEYVEEVDEDAVYDAAREVGEMTAAMHERGIVKMDNRMENVLVTDDGYASIDWEYTITDADDWDKAADLVTFVSSAKLLDRETYRAVREGFEDGYGRDEPILDGVERGFAALTSTFHPPAEAVKEGGVKEAYGAWKKAVANNIYDGLDAVR